MNDSTVIQARLNALRREHGRCQFTVANAEDPAKIERAEARMVEIVAEMQALYGQIPAPPFVGNNGTPDALLRKA